MTSSLASPFKLHQPAEIPVDECLAHQARALFGPHPFAAEMSKDQVASLLPEYFAMSQAFPYLQAGSQKDLIFDAIHRNRDLPRDVELTSVVANFICWDETGGHSRVLQGGNAALPNILDTENFHSKLFRKDASRLLGRAIQPNYSARTGQYLRALYHGLSSRDPIVRCASMVAFELHAAEMIQALWITLVKTFDARSDDLEYFRVHVGGEDPAERYHGEMTSRLISELVPADCNSRFLDEFDRAYRLSLEWCRNLIRTASLDGDGRPEVEHRGRCHCGSVKFYVRAPEEISAVKCNCSICQMSGFLHMLVPDDKFRIECGEEFLTTYQFNKNIARHTFCRVCGVKPFYRPRSNPSGFSVNVQCLDKTTIESIKIDDFDGENWEQEIRSLQAD
ncbi:GFA family protein [Bradyrhizobium cenepequi]|uniref:GFA family protein n=1 Tax=Bradyrhizobium cenepequi TaxID=2821403 RepID=UPI001CE23502|nr:GFA family protein [Bradyrhizobium cenepequi]MCA6108006.1 GFA family protein [Bradyrhizobium cenepequi]